MREDTRHSRTLSRISRMYSFAQQQFDAMETLAHAMAYLRMTNGNVEWTASNPATWESLSILQDAFHLISAGIMPYHFQIRGSRR